MQAQHVASSTLCFGLFLALLLAGSSLAQEAGDDGDPGKSASATASAGEPAGEKAEQEGGKGNFLVLPIFVTEPAIGEGLGVGLVYFHGKQQGDNLPVSTAGAMGKTGRESKPPPTGTGIFGFYTSSETAGVGIGHSGSYAEDKYRLMGALADLRVNAAFFLADIPFNFELDGQLVYGNFKRRVAESPLFLGMSVNWLDAGVDFSVDLGPEVPADVSDFSLTNVGIAGSAIYDRRDDTMMPGSGQLADLTVWRYDDAFGGDFSYWSGRLKLHSFHALHERFTLGLRFDASRVEGTPPFFAVPFVSLRGIPALRYQGKTAGAVEVEGRFDFSSRWASVAFAGAGYTKSNDLGLSTNDDIQAFGAGLRWQVIPEQNIWLGLDIAKGPEEYAWYIQIGHPW